LKGLCGYEWEASLEDTGEAEPAVAAVVARLVSEVGIGLSIADSGDDLLGSAAQACRKLLGARAVGARAGQLGLPGRGARGARDHARYVREQLAMTQPIEAQTQCDSFAGNAFERQVEQLGLAPDRERQQWQIVGLDIVGEALRHVEQMGQRVGKRASQAV